MNQRPRSQDRVADHSHPFSAPQSDEGLVNLADPRNSFLSEPQMTIGEFVEAKFIPEYVASMRSSGQAFYRSILKHVLIPEEVDRMFKANPGQQRKKLKTLPEWPYIDNMRLCDLQSEDIHRLLSAALAHGYSTQTAKHIRNVVSAIFSHARQERCFVGPNPVRLVKPPKHRRVDVIELTPDQAIEALGIMQYPEREMTLIGVFTGMSPAEIIGLQWGQVNLGDEERNEDGVRVPSRTICVRKRWYRGKSEIVEKRCQRDLPVTSPLLGILEQLKSRSLHTAPEDCILVSGVGTPINQTNVLNRRLRPIARQLGLTSLSWQAFRRIRGVLASELGAEYGLPAHAASMRIPVEDGTWTAKAAAPCPA
jgi:integrase